MLPEDWAAFLGMTQVAGVVYRRTDQKIVVGTVMGIVTIRTGHLSKTKRMATWPEGFRAGAGMTCETLFLLSQFIHHRILLRVDLVTTGAGNLFLFVHAADPVDPVAITVAGHTNLVLRARRGALGERNLG